MCGCMNIPTARWRCTGGRTGWPTMMPPAPWLCRLPESLWWAGISSRDGMQGGGADEAQTTRRGCPDRGRTPGAVSPAAWPGPGSCTGSARTAPAATRQTVVAALARQVAGLVSLQSDYGRWLDALPQATRDTATGEALQAMVDLDLEDIIAIQPPRGFGRD